MKGCENNEGFGASVVQREAERAQTINPEAEKDQGDLIYVYKYQSGGVKVIDILLTGVQ